MLFTWGGGTRKAQSRGQHARSRLDRIVHSASSLVGMLLLGVVRCTRCCCRRVVVVTHFDPVVTKQLNEVCRPGKPLDVPYYITATRHNTPTSPCLITSSTPYSGNDNVGTPMTTQRKDGGVPLPCASNTGGFPRVSEPQVQLQPRQEETVPSRGNRPCTLQEMYSLKPFGMRHFCG